jgi:hypothetical protein
VPEVHASGVRLRLYALSQIHRFGCSHLLHPRRPITCRYKLLVGTSDVPLLPIPEKQEKAGPLRKLPLTPKTRIRDVPFDEPIGYGTGEERMINLGNRSNRQNLLEVRLGKKGITGSKIQFSDMRFVHSVSPWTFRFYATPGCAQRIRGGWGCALGLKAIIVFPRGYSDASDRVRLHLVYGNGSPDSSRGGGEYTI